MTTVMRGATVGAESRTVHALFLERVRQHPARVALEVRGARGEVDALTYADVWDVAARTARVLQSRGVGAGCIVATLVDAGRAMVVTKLAILLARGCFMPVDPSLPARHMAHMLHECDFVVVRGRSDFTQAAAALRDHPGARSLRPKPVVLDVSDLISTFGGSDSHVAPDEELDGSPDDLCWIYYTSGSTGLPKGVMCEHASAVAYIRSHPLFSQGTIAHSRCGRPLGKRRCYHLVGEDEGPPFRVLVPSSFGFDPHAGDIFACFAHGGTVCLSSREEMLGDLGGCLARQDISHVCSTPALWRLVERGPDDLPHLRAVGLGGEPMSEDLVERWAGGHVLLLNLYGMTEACVYQLARVMSKGDNPRLLGDAIRGVQLAVVPLGASMQDVQLAVSRRVDAGRLSPSPLPPGLEGELVLIGRQVARGYLGSPALSAANFGCVARAGWVGTGGEEGSTVRFYRSGDVVAVRAEGLVFVGRTDRSLSENRATDRRMSL